MPHCVRDFERGFAGHAPESRERVTERVHVELLHAGSLHPQREPTERHLLVREHCHNKLT